MDGQRFPQDQQQQGSVCLEILGWILPTRRVLRSAVWLAVAVGLSRAFRAFTYLAEMGASHLSHHHERSIVREKLCF